MEYTVREMRENEYYLLKDFLYEAIYIPEGVCPPPRSVIELPELQVYISDFGKRKDDITPSFSISLYKEYRKLGIGKALMEKMLHYLKLKGYEKASLSVQKENYALRLYKNLGFQTVRETDEEYIMVKYL